MRQFEMHPLPLLPCKSPIKSLPLQNQSTEMNNSPKIHPALRPFAWLYGAGVAVRNGLFDRGILRSERFPVPVIAVGNLSVGGTGKTPHTEFLVRLLSKKYRVAVLSRGYRRMSHGFVLAGADASARTLGDEPFQMFRKFPHIIVAVDADRCRGVRRLLAMPVDRRPEVVLLDDAFQHRRIRPSLSLLLIDARRPIFDDCLLPAGRLREPAVAYRRADLVLLTKCGTETANGPLLHRPLFHTALAYKALMPVFPDSHPVRKESLERLKKEACSFLVVAGLADPSDLIRYVQQYTADLQTLVFPDHHRFRPKDLRRIADVFRKMPEGRSRIVASEKDAVRLMDHPSVGDEIKPFVYYLPVEVVFREGEEELFTQKIIHHVKSFARDGIVASSADTGRNENRHHPGYRAGRVGEQHHP